MMLRGGRRRGARLAIIMEEDPPGAFRKRISPLTAAASGFCLVKIRNWPFKKGTGAEH
jgi:hypothetical protein